MRMVQQLAAFLARMILHRSIGQTELMMVEIDKALNDWLHLNRSDLYDRPGEDLAAHLDTVEGERAYKYLMLATLLQAEAEAVLSAGAHPISTMLLYKKAKLFYDRAFQEDPDLRTREYAEYLAKVEQGLADYDEMDT